MAAGNRTPLGSIDNLLADIEASPTPYHACQRAEQLLNEAGFRSLDIAEPLPTEPGHHLVSTGGLLIAWSQHQAQQGFTIVGAHTDSPNLRLKPRPVQQSAGFVQLGVEVYGGVLLNSWLDRDLGIAGRVSIGDANGYEQVLIRLDDPLLRVPQLAIHLDRSIRSDGLKLNAQKHLTPIWTVSPDLVRGGSDDPVNTDAIDQQPFNDLLAENLGVSPDRILGHDLMAFDLQAPTTLGPHDVLFASARIDNLVSSFAAVRALASLAAEVDLDDLRRCPVVVLYDHEEVGSETATGASGAALAGLLERIAVARGADRSTFLTDLGRSVAISADGAHATHPNYVDRHDPHHTIDVNAGVVIKRNANARYATDARSEGFALAVAGEVGLDIQHYSHRNDLPCGSTIGPMLSARLAVPTVDLGVAQLAMHSIREMAGVTDAGDLCLLLRHALGSNLSV